MTMLMAAHHHAAAGSTSGGSYLTLGLAIAGLWLLFRAGKKGGSKR